MTRFFTLDFAYPDAWAALPHSTPEEWFAQCFGCADFMDVALRAAGHEAMTFMTNADQHWQVALTDYNPDVVISSNVGMWGAYEGSPLSEFRRMNPKLKLVSFCSYAAVDQTLLGWDACFSSFKWMPEHCAALGQTCHYMPLAFGRPVLDRIGELPKERDIPVAFLGGLGSRIWDRGTKTMAAIAEAVPSFEWHGYCVGSMSDLPIALQKAWRPAKYGIEYYKTLARTKIALNRHGEIARGFGNNMRQYESAGMGCILLTDHAGELEGKCCVYDEKWPDASEWIRALIDSIAISHGRSDHVLENHCYENRVVQFLETVESIS